MGIVPLVPLVTLTASLALALTPGDALAKDWTKALDKGEILVYTTKVKGFDDEAVVVKAVIEAPPEKVWKLVSNCGDYKRTMQRIVKAKMLPKRNGQVMCKVTVDMPFPYSDLTALTAAVHIVGPPKWSRQWRLVKGDYDHNVGGWTLTRWRGNAKRTHVLYRVHAKPKAWIPGWIRRAAQKRTLPKLIKHLRKLSK
jgi:ribosome-associated toxin RatA of RatAB toxin-antitoxin module